MISKDRILEISSKLKEIKAVVYGDVMLDTYIYGDIGPQNPEKKAVPIIIPQRIEYMLGGAANTANNLSHLGAEVFLYGLTGSETSASRLRRLCKKNHIKGELISIADRKTTRKIRHIVDGHYALRTDIELCKELDEKQTDGVIFQMRLESINLDVLIVSDYAKGATNERMTRYLLKIAREKGAYFIAQPKPSTFRFYEGADLIMLNLKESEEIVRGKLNSRENDPIEDSYRRTLGNLLLESVNHNSSIVITYGKHGMSFYGRDNVYEHVPTKPLNVEDGTYQGAGDTALAAYALSYIATRDVAESLRMANHAASVAIRMPGTSAPTIEDLVENL
ncbi:hypothetical protein HYX18_01440 [Candidatus Woesearchaeota archaeon]|nr:hypothetical protein [Candidatus Woesearchaeota archaeon]